MIQVRINKDKFKYDIHSLVKAFYPKEDVSVLTHEEYDAKYSSKNILNAKEHEVENNSAENGENNLFTIEIELAEEAGEISMKIIHEDGQITQARAVCDKTSDYKVHATGLDNQNSGDQTSDNQALSEQAPDKQASTGQNSTNGTSASLTTPKNALKQMMYRELVKEIGHDLPWGSLTGIRPTRIPMQMLEAGKDELEIKSYMQDTFFVSDEKTELAYNIALREKKILDEINYENGYSIYLGIPFCPTTCLYCSFTSFPIVTWKKKVDAYIDCLLKEIDYVAEAFKGKVVNSVYIGGGTPTTLEPDQMTRLITYLREKINLSDCREFTVESGRPDSITREKLRAMKECGVDRISVNPQTMSDETLRRIGRQHTVTQFVDAYNIAREEGFDNINMDIILGLPGETESDVLNTMKEIEKLGPDDLTVHSLSVKRGSRLAEHIRNNGFFVAGDTGRMMEIAKEGAARMGLTPYYLYRQKNISGNLENTGYAREGKAGIYNILMMEEVQSIVALGTGTVTKRVYGDGRIERCDNVKDVTLYMNSIDEMIERKRKLFES